MTKPIYVLVLSVFCCVPLGAANAASVTFVGIDSGSSSISVWNGSDFVPHGVEGTIKVTIDVFSFIDFNFDDVTTIPDSGFLGSPAVPEVFYDGLNFDNRGQYDPCCLPVVYDEIWGTFDGINLSFQGSGGAHMYNFSINASAVSAVPVPTASLLFASGILALIGCTKTKTK